jgi:hypothetical protein
VVGVVGICLLAASVPTYARSFGDRRSHLASDSRAIALLNVRAGQWIHANAPAGAAVAATDAGGIRYFGERYTIDLLGLNNQAIAFGKMTAEEAVGRSDWLAICPALFSGTEMAKDIMAEFRPRTELRIAPAEYTICDNPYQAVVLILERVSPAHSSGAQEAPGR